MDTVNTVAAMIRQPSPGDTQEMINTRMNALEATKYLFSDGLILLVVIAAYYHRFSAIVLIRLMWALVFFYCKEFARIGLFGTHAYVKMILETISGLAFIIIWVSQKNNKSFYYQLKFFSLIQLPYVRIFDYFDRRRAREGAELLDESQGQLVWVSNNPGPEGDDRHHRERPPVRNQAMDDYLENLEDERMHRRQVAELIITAHMFGYFDRLEQEQLRNQPAGQISDLYRLYINLGDHFRRQENNEEGEDRELTDAEADAEYRRIRIYEYLQRYYSFMSSYGRHPPQGGALQGADLVLQQLIHLQRLQVDGVNGGGYVMNEYLQRLEQQQRRRERRRRRNHN